MIPFFCRDKTTFLCSQKVPSAAIVKIYRWGQSVRNANEFIMSGFHTKLEGDIYDLLLNSKTRLIEVCARGLPKNLPSAKRELIERGHLLLVSPFVREKRRQTKAQAHARNIFVLRQAPKSHYRLCHPKAVSALI